MPIKDKSGPETPGKQCVDGGNFSEQFLPFLSFSFPPPLRTTDISARFTIAICKQVGKIILFAYIQPSINIKF